MNVLLNSACKRPLGQIMRVSISLYSTLPPISTLLLLQLQELCSVVTSTAGGLDELEFSLNKYRDSLTSSLVTQAIDSCKHEAHTRRLLRFFLWTSKKLSCKLEDKDYNYALQVFIENKDYRTMDILIGDLKKKGRVMDAETFGLVAETLVKLRKEDEALGIFKNLDKYKCSIDEFTVTEIINALCSRGHPKRAEGVVWHHKDKIAGTMLCIYRRMAKLPETRGSLQGLPRMGFDCGEFFPRRWGWGTKFSRGRRGDPSGDPRPVPAIPQNL
ncbi:hypothetical protein Ahy_B04g071347 [Arachis hypogaea]|uniref:Pentatricopeptide repeat-containing protein n=1 Tax=Arachis hypogaea TaxID=3818 RepID=A0A444ZKJ6_ARAHY|nr:hypothetical protein Ahy_B04g071347 [Arachis hypogaea]